MVKNNVEKDLDNPFSDKYNRFIMGPKSLQGNYTKQSDVQMRDNGGSLPDNLVLEEELRYIDRLVESLSEKTANVTRESQATHKTAGGTKVTAPPAAMSPAQQPGAEPDSMVFDESGGPVLQESSQTMELNDSFIGGIDSSPIVKQPATDAGSSSRSVVKPTTSGLSIPQTGNYQKTYYIYSFDRKLLAEYDQTGQCTREYIYLGSKLIAEYRPMTDKYFYYIDDSPKPQFSNKESEQTTDLDYFGARYYDHATYRFNSTDPIINKKEAVAKPQLWNLYSYCRNNPVSFLDPDGNKDRPFQKGDKLITYDAGTETPRRLENGNYNSAAYNCHSYAWHNSMGDPTDFRNRYLVSIGIKRWDNNPDDDMGKYRMLKSNDANMQEDRLIYYVDADGNGRYDKGEYIDHSAIVQEVDKEGNTTIVRSKNGENGISHNHPGAPGYYEKTRDGRKLERAYFRKK